MCRLPPKTTFRINSKTSTQRRHKCLQDKPQSNQTDGCFSVSNKTVNMKHHRRRRVSEMTRPPPASRRRSSSVIFINISVWDQMNFWVIVRSGWVEVKKRLKCPFNCCKDTSASTSCWVASCCYERLLTASSRTSLFSSTLTVCCRPQIKHGASSSTHNLTQGALFKARLLFCFLCNPPPPFMLRLTSSA